MPTQLVVATFRADTDMAEVFAVVAEEQAQVEHLTAEGRLGSIYLSLARSTVFLETFGADADDARAIVGALPMSQWWDLDVFPLGAPEVAR